MPEVNGLATMQRTTVTLNRDLLRELESQLGTHGPTETVNAAMEELVRQQKRMRAAELAITQEGIDPDVLAQVRETGWRHEPPT